MVIWLLKDLQKFQLKTGIIRFFRIFVIVWMGFSMQFSKKSWRHILGPIMMKHQTMKDVVTIHSHMKLLRDWLRNDRDMIFWKFAPCKWMAFFQTLAIFCDVIDKLRAFKFNWLCPCTPSFNMKIFQEDWLDNLRKNMFGTFD